MKLIDYKVADVADLKSTDLDGRTRGVVIMCSGQNLVSLLCDSSIPYDQTDELARLLRKMKLTTVVVQNGI
jgi:hypothetical protein